MDIFSIISLFGGLAFFLYGMRVMSGGLEKATNGKFHNSLTKLTGNRFVAMICGAGMTIAVQSSSAVTVMLVGLVNSGVLEFGQTIGVLMGSNIGTTLTAWILSLAGIDSDVFWLNLLKPANFAPIFALIGIVMIMVSKKEKFNSAGEVMVGFAILMFGMNVMSGAMEPLAEMPEFRSILTAFKNPLLAVAVGAIFTGIIQSSAASVAILQAFSIAGGLTYGAAIPIIMGQNIGTCVTALISSIGVSRNAKKVAVVHLSFNLIGTLICLIPFCLGSAIFDWAFIDWEITPFMIAVVHSIFNVVTTGILLPFSKQLEKLANKIIPETGVKKTPVIKLDDRLLTIPSMAVQRSFDAVTDMCRLSKKALTEATGLLVKYDEAIAADILEMENTLDEYEDRLGTYMMKLSKIGVSEEDSKNITKILHSIDDFERIGDHAVSLLKVAEELHTKKIHFSAEANKEIAKATEAVCEIINITETAFKNNDLETAALVEPLEQVIDSLIAKIRRHHIKRLQNGECTIELGFVLSDLLNCYSRTSDHCSNVAAAIIESEHGTFDTHKYLDSIKNHGDKGFNEKYAEYSERFSLSK